MRITTVSSGFTTTQAFTSGEAARGAWACVWPGMSGTWNPTTSAPVVATEPPRKRRRDT